MTPTSAPNNFNQTTSNANAFTKAQTIVTTPWTKFRYENNFGNLSSFNNEPIPTVAPADSLSINQKFKNINTKSQAMPRTERGKPGTAPGTTRAHRRVNVVLKKFDNDLGLTANAEELVRLASESFKPTNVPPYQIAIKTGVRSERS